MVKFVVWYLGGGIYSSEAAGSKRRERWIDRESYYTKYPWTTNKITHNPPIIPTSAQANALHSAWLSLASVWFAVEEEFPVSEKNLYFGKVSLSVGEKYTLSHLAIRHSSIMPQCRCDD